MAFGYSPVLYNFKFNTDDLGPCPMEIIGDTKFGVEKKVEPNESKKFEVGVKPIAYDYEEEDKCIDYSFELTSSEKYSTKKKYIPKKIKTDTWETYMGKNYEGLCMCCSRRQITIQHFHCGHVISEFNGGKTEIANLRPVCSECNLSMKTKHMLEFMKEYGYKKPKNWNGYKQIKPEVIVIE